MFLLKGNSLEIDAGLLKPVSTSYQFPLFSNLTDTGPPISVVIRFTANNTKTNKQK